MNKNCATVRRPFEPEELGKVTDRVQRVVTQRNIEKGQKSIGHVFYVLPHELSVEPEEWNVQGS